MTRLSVVTPTLGRPEEVGELLENLGRQTVLPDELLLVDAAPEGDERTQNVVDEMKADLPFVCRHIRHGGGTAIQRNVGIEGADGDFIAFVDDDIRLESDFFEEMLGVFEDDPQGEVGGVVGYITNQHLDPASSPRWRWYRRLRLFTTYEPGRYDFETGYPINRYLQPPHDGLREMDFVSTNCAVWRRQVFDEGLRFSEFFVGYGILEDAHLSLRASRHWKLLENGRARCVHLRSPRSRANSRKIAYMSAVNFRYVFLDLVPQRTWRQELRFWRVQLLDLLRFLVVFIRRPDRLGWGLVVGKLEGLAHALRLRPDGKGARNATDDTAERKSR